ncbi:MAG: AbrB/MazE/SpoVT family DNA-binding domain-containing protein [Candidatus Diapherotrites archaeon]
MNDLVAVARKWGNSIGVTFSKELVEKQRIKPNDRLVISVRKAKGIESLFGTLKTKKSAQKIKDELRQGWD